MNAIIAEKETVRELPDDLRLWMDERELLTLARQAVQNVIAHSPLADETFAGSTSRRLLTLVTYCYATDSFGSQDIEWATRHEAEPRYICAREFPTWETIRQFRKANRRRIEQCLGDLLHRAIRDRQAAEVALDPIDSLLPGEAEFDVDLWVARRLQLAVIMDTAACD